MHCGYEALERDGILLFVSKTIFSGRISKSVLSSQETEDVVR